MDVEVAVNVKIRFFRAFGMIYFIISIVYPWIDSCLFRHISRASWYKKISCILWEIFVPLVSRTSNIFVPLTRPYNLMEYKE